MYDIVYDIVYKILQYIGRIGIPRLRKVALMYRTIEIGTFPGPTRAWAVGNLERDRTISMPTEDAISICVLVLRVLERKVLAALKTFVSH